jgi:hypothetical protein
MSIRDLQTAVAGGLPIDAIQFHPIDIAWLRAKVHTPGDPLIPFNW